MKKNIASTDYRTVIADSFEILVDSKPKYPAKPVIGLKVDPVDAEAFTLPIEFTTARDLAMLMMKTLMVEAPELFVGKF